MKELRNYQKQAVHECWAALKENDEPVLLMASVGSGKSLMIADILITMEKLGRKALCLVNNAELVRNNCATFKEQGGNASIYCAALGLKDAKAPVIFGTPQSILNGINQNADIAQIKFNIIVVDEAHAINYLDNRSVFMRILRHYKQEYPQMRLLGATGTNFRYKGTEIVGSHSLFKRQVGNITTERLIEQKYLIAPHFTIDDNLVIDFSKVKIKSNGKFDSKELELVISKNARLTELICKQIIYIMETQARFGIFIFATTKKHAEEIMSHLPPQQSALILGETPQDERTRILNEARKGQIKYLVNIAIISVGVDVPAFDTLAYLRPTESLVLLVQTLGRVLRLSTHTDKNNALVMDFAGNIERHRDWDNPILLEAVRQTLDKLKDMVIKCPKCFELNSEYARRCVGERHYTNDVTGKTQTIRCDYFFEFKECPNEECEAQNDIASRHCRLCKAEIIDPNAKLKLECSSDNTQELKVITTKYGLTVTTSGFKIHCAYMCEQQSGGKRTFYEYFYPINEKAKHYFYGQFIKKHCQNPSDWYPHLMNPIKMQEMLEFASNPDTISVKKDGDGFKIKKKFFL